MFFVFFSNRCFCFVGERFLLALALSRYIVWKQKYLARYNGKAAEPGDYFSMLLSIYLVRKISIKIIFCWKWHINYTYIFFLFFIPVILKVLFISFPVWTLACSDRKCRTFLISVYMVETLIVNVCSFSITHNCIFLHKCLCKYAIWFLNYFGRLWRITQFFVRIVSWCC